MVGELVEFVAGALGASRAGASRKSTIYAVLGSFVGALAGGFIGIPIPIIGSLVAALLFGSLGATAGAMYGEWSDGKSWRDSWTVGHAAFWGRLLGTLGKIVAGLGIILTVVVGVFLCEILQPFTKTTSFVYTSGLYPARLRGGVVVYWHFRVFTG